LVFRVEAGLLPFRVVDEVKHASASFEDSESLLHNCSC
jgi:hypothetical protein